MICGTRPTNSSKPFMCINKYPTFLEVKTKLEIVGKLLGNNPVIMAQLLLLNFNYYIINLLFSL